jgi:non-ribosomal peptide synthetase component F
LSRSPLFQVKLVLLNTPDEEVQFTGLQSGSLETDVLETKLDLHLMFRYSPKQGIAGILRYAADLFERESASRLLRQLEMVLETAAAGPDQPLSSILKITRDERRRIEEEWTVDEESLLARLDQLSAEEIERLLGESEPKGVSLS